MAVARPLCRSICLLLPAPLAVRSRTHCARHLRCCHGRASATATSPSGGGGGQRAAGPAHAAHRPPVARALREHAGADRVRPAAAPDAAPTDHAVREHVPAALLHAALDHPAQGRPALPERGARTRTRARTHTHAHTQTQRAVYRLYSTLPHQRLVE